MTHNVVIDDDSEINFLMNKVLNCSNVESHNDELYQLITDLIYYILKNETSQDIKLMIDTLCQKCINYYVDTKEIDPEMINEVREVRKFVKIEKHMNNIMKSIHIKFETNATE